MNALIVLTILMIPVFTLCLESGRLTPLTVTSVSLTPVLFGYVELDMRNGSHSAVLYSSAVVCFISGALLHGRWSSSRIVRRTPNRHAVHIGVGALFFIL